MQEYFSSFEFSSERLLTVSLILVFVYLVLTLIDGFLIERTIFGRWHQRVTLWVHNFFLIYEPVAVLLITASLILISPIFFGLLSLIIFATGLNHMRNYISGRIVQLGRGMEIGQQISTRDFQGIISSIGRFGFKVKTSKGVLVIAYPRVLEQGYTLSAGEDLGGFYKLAISSQEKDQRINIFDLKDRFASSPFLDWNQDLSFSYNLDNHNNVEGRVLVREDHHLQDLVTTIREWGYNCKVSKK
ncbi:MAG: hypothetical protein HKN16_01785 [Saprospiraceae bacterium]|nr:hypothetical protein [Saprospiraceae bacterium]